MSHWKKLLGMIRVSKRWKKSVKHHLFNANRPEGSIGGLRHSQRFAAAWWELSEWLSTPVLAKRKERSLCGSYSWRSCLAPRNRRLGRHAAFGTHLPHRSAMLEALNARPEPEEISSTLTPPNTEEE